jgi:tetratricopeptide (TPR) repeat protein
MRWTMGRNSRIFWPGLTLAALMTASCVSAAKRQAAANERNPQYQYEKAVVCMKYNIVDEALKYLSAALALDPRHALALNLQGLAFTLKGNPAEAIKSFEAAIASNPNFSEAHNNLGMAYQESNRLQDAIASFQKAYALDENYNASFNLAKAYYLQEKPEEALGWVQRSIAKFNSSAMAFNLQGVILDKLGRQDEAIASYQQALRLAPGDLYVQCNMGVAYFNKKSFARAKEIMTGILEELVKNPKAGNEDLRARVQDVLKRLAER